MSQVALAENWIWAKLGDITEIVGGGTPTRDNLSYFQGTIPWVSPSDITKLNDIWIDETAESITENGLKSSSAVLLPVGTVLMTCRASFGLVAINRREMCTSQSLYSFVCNPAFIFNEYLAYYLKTIKDRLAQLAGETTFKGISKSTLAKVEIPLPPLSEQLRIAAILRETDEIRKLRQQANEKTQKIVESLFYDMFGDPIRNEKNWECLLLSDIVAADCPITYGIVQPGNELEQGIPIVRPVDLTQRIIELDNLKRIDEVIAEKYSRTKLRGIELLLSVRGQVGSLSMVDHRLIGANVTRGIVPLWFNVKADINYIYNLLKIPSMQSKLKDMAVGIALKQINLEALRKLSLPIPPMPLQQILVEKVEKLWVVSEQQGESGKSLYGLYQTIIAQAFSGELTTSWRKSQSTELWRESLRAELEQAAEERDRLLKGLDGATKAPPQQLHKSQITNRTDLTKGLTILQTALLKLIDGQRDNYFTATRVHDDIWLRMDEQGIYLEASDREGKYRLFAGLDCSLDTTRRELHFLARMGLVKELTLPVEEESGVGIVHYITAYRSLRDDDDCQQQDLGLLNPDQMEEALT